MIKTLLIILISCNSFLQAVESYASFADWNVGARSLGMGRAYVGLANDGSALYWNPAGIMNMKSMQGFFQMTMLYEDYSMMYGSFAMPGAESGLGFEFMMLSGGFEGRDKYNQLTQMMSDSKMAAGVSFSKKLMPNLSLGIKGKYYMRSLGDASDMAVAGDLSMMYLITDKLSAGWSLNNVLGMVLGKTSDRLKNSSVVGISHKEKDFIINLDARENFNEWHLGVEWALIPILPLRFGVNNYELTFGGGLNLGIMQFDFAYVMKELGSNIGFSSNFSFGEDMNTTQKNKIDDYIKEAQELLSYDYFFMAKKKFENILILDPRKQEVVEIIERINKVMPHIESSLDIELITWEKLKEARKMLDGGKLGEAQKLLEEIQKVNPGNRFIINMLDDIKTK